MKKNERTKGKDLRQKKYGQCFGAETICFGSSPGSGFQKVSAPVPELAPAPNIALYLPFITVFMLKNGFFMFFMKEYRLNSRARSYSI